MVNIYTAGDGSHDPTGLSMGQLSGLIGSGGRITVSNNGVTFYSQSMEMRQNVTNVKNTTNSSVEYVMVEHKEFHSFDSIANQRGSSEEPFNRLGNYGKVNAFVGGEVPLLDQALATGRLEMAAESVKGLKGLGVAGGIAGMTMDGIGVYNYYHPTAENVNSRVTPNKLAIDGGMTALGLWGGLPGEGTAAFYFGVDAFYPGGVAGFGNAQVSEPIDGIVITGSL